MIRTIITNTSGIFSSSSFVNMVLKKPNDDDGRIFFIEVSPAAISHISIIPESAPWLRGPNANFGCYYGMFDLLKKPFKKHFMYSSVYKMLQGGDIRETEFYIRLLKTFEEEEALKQVEKLSRMINRMRKTGYLSQYELGNMESMRMIGPMNVPRNEAIVGLDRKGRLFRLLGGRHRLAISQNLKLEKMNAILSLVHRDARDKLPVKNRVIKNYPEDFRPF